MLKRSCKIVIPSHKRHDVVSTTEWVNDAIICVEENQVELYKDFNPDNEIVAHPNEIKGLIPKRNWMLKHFGDLFMLDDDIIRVQKNYHSVGENGTIKDKSFITRKIYELHELAVLLDSPLFGFTKNPRPEQFNVFKPYSMSNMITGCAYGALADKDLYWNEEMKVKEDFWISCLCKYKHRKILVDNRYNFVQKDTFISSGGLAEIRNHDEELRSILILKKHFGDTLKLKRERKTAKLRKKYDVTATFKF